MSLAWLPSEEEAVRAAELIANRPQNLWDVERLLLLWRERMDLSRVRRVLAELAEHIEGPDRLQTLADLLESMPSPRAARAAPRAAARKPKGRPRRGQR